MSAFADGGWLDTAQPEMVTAWQSCGAQRCLRQIKTCRAAAFLQKTCIPWQESYETEFPKRFARDSYLYQDCRILLVVLLQLRARLVSGTGSAEESCPASG